ncbi:MAG: VWA domain-containing protein [Candidatus Sulfotelmatobacter sp.]
MLRPVVVLASFLLTATQLFSQQAVSQQLPQPSVQPAPAVTENRTSLQPQELAKLTARTDLVLVPVVVTDKSGKHVSGLQKEVFRIEENGSARSISVFEETKTEKLAAGGKHASVDGYSNFVPGDGHPWRLTTIVLDMINTPWMRQLEARKQLIDYLLRTASHDEPMAIFGLNGSGLHQLHPFTTDTKVLIEALRKLKLSLSAEEGTQTPEQFTDDPSEEQQASDEEMLMSDFMQDLSDTLTANYQRVATRETLVAMTQLTHALQAIPGRKTLTWASAGFPFTIDDPQSFARQGDDLFGEYQEAWRGLNSANIAVYPVDLNALDFSTRNLPSANSGVSSTQLNNIQGKNGLKSALRLPYDKFLQQQMTLHAFADATGGRACVTVNELEKCFAEAVDDSRDYYLLGYYLGDDRRPGWRKLKVNVAGDGLRVRYRSGFYVTPKMEESANVRRKALADALASPVQYTGLRLTARLLPPSTDIAPPASGAGNKRSAEFMLGVMGSSIMIDREKGNAIDLEVITLAFDNNRKSVATTSQAIATGLKPERVQHILQTGIGVPEKLDLTPGKYEVKFAVRDNFTGMLGTVSVPIELN